MEQSFELQGSTKKRRSNQLTIAHDPNWAIPCSCMTVELQLALFPSQSHDAFWDRYQPMQNVEVTALAIPGIFNVNKSFCGSFDTLQ